MMPIQGTAYAREVDVLFMFIFWLSAALFIGIAAALGWFIWKYRRRGSVAPTPNISHNTTLEVVWSVVPLLICIGIFFWGLAGYIHATVPPGEAMEIQVTAKKWLWTFEYPTGMRTINELHVPLGRPVKFVMTSEDVLHSFFVPTARVKMDIIPNRYTELWFQPTLPGLHRLMCAEYCGKSHSDMAGKIFVDDEAKYRDWLETGGDEGKSMPLKDFGALLFESRGCNTCHTIDGSKNQGPTFKGIFGHEVKLSDGKTVMIDENYIRESILTPQAKIVAGFEGIMPTFQGLLRDREISALIEFIKAQK
jgi:cytochrome c oxidase subunit II